jgi:hypothetical protein
MFGAGLGGHRDRDEFGKGPKRDLDAGAQRISERPLLLRVNQSSSARMNPCVARNWSATAVSMSPVWRMFNLIERLRQSLVQAYHCTCSGRAPIQRTAYRSTSTGMSSLFNEPLPT